MSEMTPQTEADRWLAASLRLTAFHTAPLVDSKRDWWMELRGVPPSEYTVKPNTQELQAFGPLDIGNLVHITNPGLVEWRITPQDPDQMRLEGFPVPNLGSFDQALEYFLSLMLPWLREQCPDLSRMAFGAELLLPFDSLLATYEWLSKQLSLRLDKDSSDFSYHINRKRDARIEIPHLRINRYSKWRALRASIGAMLGGQAFDLPGLDHFTAHLELDINTVANFQGTLPRASLSALFEELVELGLEIKTKGDI